MFKKLPLVLSFLSIAAGADEGMWQPHQLPEIAGKLQQAGLKLSTDKLTNLTEFPMGAIVSLGGCTASFVSEQGLIATNHHCIHGSVQYNSTEENNLLEKGFLAKELSEELPATPGSRVYVTEKISNVTEAVLQGLTPSMEGAERYATIDKNSKHLVAQCEIDPQYRCSVVNFHGGLSYYLFKQLTLKDVRLVHAPALSIGKYGGDIDNWMWPRHTGDYGFYRAYVDKNGKPADFHPDNVPYQPKHHLKVNKRGVAENDYIMAIGYPGRTNRYRTSLEVENQFTWVYPTAKHYRESVINVIESNSAPASDARIKYESTLAGLSNYAKNYGSMISSYHKGNTLQDKQTLEAQLNAWIEKDSNRQQRYGTTLSALNKLIAQDQEYQARDLLVAYFRYNKMLSSAYTLHRLAIEKEKSDIERKQGYQKRDEASIKQNLQTVNRRYDQTIDKQILLSLLKKYQKLPSKQRVTAIDRFFKLDKNTSDIALSNQLDAMYKSTTLDDESSRLAWLELPVSAFNKSNDPFIQLAVSTFATRKKIEQEQEALSGQIQALRPQYMAALIAYFNDLNLPVYADANSTLRVTYGNVKGYQPKDGLQATPFTTLEGISAKDTGITPFNAPKAQLSLIKQKHYGDYHDKNIKSVPVNFLANLDITGGNSGSPTLNNKAEFIGLAFDGVYESIIGDWSYDAKLNRSIHVDVRYMLWVMEHIDGATHLINEMDIVE